MIEPEYAENIHNFIMRSILPYKINLYSEQYDYDNYGIGLHTGYAGVGVDLYTWNKNFKYETNASNRDVRTSAY
jgi:hypothetical protein